jgi:hypothetical protein
MPYADDAGYPRVGVLVLENTGQIRVIRQDSPGGPVRMSDVLAVEGGAERLDLLDVLSDVAPEYMAGRVVALGISGISGKVGGRFHEPTASTSGSKGVWIFQPSLHLRAREAAARGIDRLWDRVPVSNEAMSLTRPGPWDVEHLAGPDRPLSEGVYHVFIGHDSLGATVLRLVRSDGWAFQVAPRWLDWTDAFPSGTYEARVMAQYLHKAYPHRLPSLLNLAVAAAKLQYGDRAPRLDREATVRGFFSDDASPDDPLIRMWQRCVAFAAVRLLRQEWVDSVVLGGRLLVDQLSAGKLPLLRGRLDALDAPVWTTGPTAALWGTLAHVPINWPEQDEG